VKGTKRNMDKGIGMLCSGEEDVRCILLDSLEKRNWRMKVSNEKWLNMNEEVAYMIILRRTNKDQIRNLGRHLDKVKYKWFNKTKEV
jgi:hypothetical protein